MFPAPKAAEEIEIGEYASDYEREEAEEVYSDGTWCAEIEYYNSNTGTRRSYDLDVEVESGELVEISWPNGGWPDESHFSSEDISSGECSFTSDRGYEYTVTLVSKGGCRSGDEVRLQSDLEEEEEMITCPKCGNEKDSDEKLCSDCQDELETCPKCHGIKFDDQRICSSCEEEANQDEENDN